MATTLNLVTLGTTSTAAPILAGQQLSVAPALQGGSVTLNVGPTQTGPFTTIFSASTVGVSYVPSVNQWYTVTAATQAGVALVSDALQSGTLITLNSPVDSSTSTSEQVLFSFRLPAKSLPSNFRCELSGRLSLTNNANVKTMQCRMNGLAGTLFHQSAALASLADYNFIAGFSGIGDGATLKGYGAGSAGGLGTSTTAYTTLANAYLTTEIEIVVTVTKATGTDTMKLDALQVVIS
jgi:hypothetical protein